MKKSYERFMSGEESEEAYKTGLCQKDGVRMDVQLSVAATCHQGVRSGLIVVRDITRLKQIQQGKKELKKILHHSQRMEAIGTLAGSIADETLFSALREELGLAYTDENELYAAMDWLVERQDRIEVQLAKQHLQEGTLVLYDVTSTYFGLKTLHVLGKQHCLPSCSRRLSNFSG